MLKHQRSKFTTAQKVILTVIILAIITVIVTAISVLTARPENAIKSKIEELSSDYYENYIYESIINSENFSGDIKATLEKYTETGFSAITLRDLILHDTKKTKDIAPFLKQYCDQNGTTIKFYPETPFDKKAYRIEYNYSCEFE